MTVQLPEKIAAHIDQFTGRKWLLPRILDWFDNSSERLLLITGEPGTGKSMLTAWLANFGPPPDTPQDAGQLMFLRNQVYGVHFCQAGGGSITPKNLSINLHYQLKDSLPLFNQAFIESLPELIRLEATQRFGQVDAGAQVTATNVSIDNLHLGDYGDETSFFRLLHDPLRKLYELGYDLPMLILVDSLDEAATYTFSSNRPQDSEGGKFTILDLLKTLKELPAEVRFLATLRPDERLLKNYYGARRIDLGEDALASLDDVRRYAFNQLDATPEPDRSVLAGKVAEASEGVFLYADLVVRDLKANRYKNPLAETFKFPAGMRRYYHLSLIRELGAGMLTRWQDEFSPLLGLIAVSQASGLSRSTLERIRGQDITQPLNACLQYLDGDPARGPFRLFHKSLADFLLEDEENQTFHINAWTPHTEIANHYWGSPNGKPDYSKWDSYAYHYLPIHLAGASFSTNETTSQLEAARIVRLVTSPDFQKRHQVKVKDFSSLQRQVETGLQVALGRRGLQALPLVVRAALGMFEFHQGNQRPELVFESAQNGQIDEALRQLNLLKNVDPYWQNVATLVIAWLAAGQRPVQARDLHNQVVSSQPLRYPLDLLAYRVDASLNGNLEGVLAGLPPLPDRIPSKAEVEEILKRAGGQNVNESMIGQHLNTAGEYINEAMLETINQAGQSAPDFLANQDGLPLVAYAVNHPEDAWVFENYLRIHAANRYVQYRNLSLQFLSDAVLRHPEQVWVRDTMRQLTEASLSRGGADFTEALPIARLALAARAGTAGASQQLVQLRQSAIQSASELSSKHNRTDQWGEHKRRLTALALAYHFHGDTAASQECLQAALQAPAGFAGYMYTTWLNLAETICILQAKSKFSPLTAWRQALESAQNIQGTNFSAWATARVHAILARSWRRPGKTLVETVDDFISRPADPRFSPFHIVHDPFRGRDRSSTKVPLRPSLQAADQLQALAGELGASIDELALYNPEFAPDQPLPSGTRVFLPDPIFIPLMSTHLAGALMQSEDLFPEEKQPLIQQLIPLTLTDRTALDTVLARLILASEPGDPALIQAIGEAYV